MHSTWTNHRSFVRLKLCEIWLTEILIGLQDNRKIRWTKKYILYTSRHISDSRIHRYGAALFFHNTRFGMCAHLKRFKFWEIQYHCLPSRLLSENYEHDSRIELKVIPRFFRLSLTIISHINKAVLTGPSPKSDGKFRNVCNINLRLSGKCFFWASFGWETLKLVNRSDCPAPFCAPDCEMNDIKLVNDYLGTGKGLSSSIKQYSTRTIQQ